MREEVAMCVLRMKSYMTQVNVAYVQFTNTFPGAWTLSTTCELQWYGNVSTIHDVNSSWLFRRGSQGRVMMLGRTFALSALNDMQKTMFCSESIPTT